MDLTCGLEDLSRIPVGICIHFGQPFTENSIDIGMIESIFVGLPVDEPYHAPTGPERHSCGQPRRRIHGCSADSADSADLCQFVEKMEILRCLSPVHPADVHIGPCRTGHRRPDGMKGIGRTGERKANHVGSQKDLITADCGVEPMFKRLLMGVLYDGSRIARIMEMTAERFKIVGFDQRIGVETENLPPVQSLSFKKRQCGIHTDLPCRSYTAIPFRNFQARR